MHPAAKLQFERMIGEFVRWREVPEGARSPAPAWWWGPAFEMRNMQEPMPAGWGSSLEIAASSSYAAGAEVFLRSLADQTSLPWPDDFPRRTKHAVSP